MNPILKLVNGNFSDIKIMTLNDGWFCEVYSSDTGEIYNSYGDHNLDDYSYERLISAIVKTMERAEKGDIKYANRKLSKAD